MRGIIISLIVLSVASGMTISHLWTGDGGDNRWENPLNWNRGTVPGPADDVTITAGSTCIIENPVSVATFDNHGTVQTPPGGPLSISAGILHNSGNLTAGGELYLNPRDIMTNSGGIWSGKDMRIAGRDISNEGNIESGPGDDDNGANIEIMGNVVNNLGSIVGGGGLDGGGDVNIVAKEVYNEGEIRAGSGALVGSSNGDLNIHTDCLDNEGSLEGGGSESDRRYRSLDEPQYGNVTVIADSVEIHPASDTNRIEAVDTLRIICRKLRVYDLYSISISTTSCALFLNTTDGYANFSGISTPFSITSDGYNSIYSNNYTPPPIDFVFMPAPGILTPDTTIVGGIMTSDFAFSEAGATDSLNVILQNQSTTSKVLNFSISSTKGWLSSVSSNTGLLSPFQFVDFQPDFTIPAGTGVGVEDTVMAILTIAPGFADTSYSRIFCISAPVAVEENFRKLPENLTISAYPNPFNSAVRIAIDAPSVETQNLASLQIEVFDINGRRVAELPEYGTVGSRRASTALDKTTGDAGVAPTTREFTWSPDNAIPSGIYLVRTRIDPAQRPDGGRGDLVPTGQTTTKRIVYLK